MIWSVSSQDFDRTRYVPPATLEVHSHAWGGSCLRSVAAVGTQRLGPSRWTFLPAPRRALSKVDVCQTLTIQSRSGHFPTRRPRTRRLPPPPSMSGPSSNQYSSGGRDEISERLMRRSRTAIRAPGRLAWASCIPGRPSRRCSRRRLPSIFFSSARQTANINPSHPIQPGRRHRSINSPVVGGAASRDGIPAAQAKAD